jgi:mono/diheme cytochrome c family protein
MRNTFLPVVLVCTCVLGLVVSGCKGPEGPAGPAGATTAVNLEGFAPGIQCAQCHNPDTDSTYFIAGRDLQWQNSGHKNMGDFDENRAACAGCHTSEGFIQRMNGETVTDDLDPTPVGCFACHSPHSRGDFTLRTTAQPTLLSNMVGVPNATFNYGEGNLCVQCHQPRSVTASNQMDPTKLAPTDTLTITTTRWYGHHGLQGQMLMGVGGFEYQGYQAGNVYPKDYHTTAQAILDKGCPVCHMADASPTAANAGRVGGHSMNIVFTDPTTGAEAFNAAACNVAGCHSSAPLTTVDYNNVQDSIQYYLNALYTKFGQLGWLDTVPTSSNYGLVKLTNGRLKIAQASRGGALWNYFFVQNDGSLGVHNYKYALALLHASWAEVNKP